MTGIDAHDSDALALLDAAGDPFEGCEECEECPPPSRRGPSLAVAIVTGMLAGWIATALLRRRMLP